MAVGLVLQAMVGVLGRQSGDSQVLLFWVSLVLIYSSGAAVLFVWAGGPSRAAPVLLILSIMILLTRTVLYPNSFVYHDELVHVDILRNIGTTGHLFTHNSTIPVAPYYPGLEIATDGMRSLLGLSAHAAGTVVLLLARILMVLGMYRVFDLLSGRREVASVGVLVYTTNPQYVFFNSQFSYQSLALPLCIFAVYLFAARDRQQRHWLLAFAAAVATAAVSHHLTSIALASLMCGWAGLAAVRGRLHRDLAVAAAVVVIIVGAWTGFTSHALLPYLTEIAQNAYKNVIALIQGRSTHKFFKDSAGDPTPPWERYLSLCSVIVICLLLVPSTLEALRWWRKRVAAALALGIVAAAYPIVPLGHLTDATSEVADRSSSFLFVGLGFTLAWWWYRRSRNGWTVMATYVTLIVLFIGGTVVGSGPTWLRSPGAYLVEADNRSVDQYNVAAATWAGKHLAAGQRVYADRVNGLLMTLYGHQHDLTSLGDHVSADAAGALLLGPPSASDVATIRRYHIQYLVADRRLSRSLPHVNVYIDNGEYGSATRKAPPPVAYLEKFDHVLGVGKIYDNGFVAIYDLRDLDG